MREARERSIDGIEGHAKKNQHASNGQWMPTKRSGAATFTSACGVINGSEPTHQVRHGHHGGQDFETRNRSTLAATQSSTHSAWAIGGRCSGRAIPAEAIHANVWLGFGHGIVGAAGLHCLLGSIGFGASSTGNALSGRWGIISNTVRRARAPGRSGAARRVAAPKFTTRAPIFPDAGAA